MYRFIFNRVKSIIPKISDTELIALRSGNTSLDRDILKGKVFFPKSMPYKEKFPKESLSQLLNQFDNTPIYPRLSTTLSM